MVLTLKMFVIYFLIQILLGRNILQLNNQSHLFKHLTIIVTIDYECNIFEFNSKAKFCDMHKMNLQNFTGIFNKLIK